MKHTRICLWSGPRNVSTALMYSFAQRSDTQVVDEPLYAHYLQLSGADHPGREEILAAQENEGAKVVEQMMGEWNRPVVFFKQMAHHLQGLNLDFLKDVVNILLIRNPAEVLISFSKVIPNPVADDIGIRIQWDLFRQMQGTGKEPIVIEGPELLKDPEGILQKLCSRIGIPFEPAMLEWEAGTRPEDGVWAPYWYSKVHESRTFIPWQERNNIVPDHLKPVLEESMPYYEMLHPYILT